MGRLGVRLGMIGDGSDSPRLSLCMIARNEADILGLALESVRDVVDEIVLIDTGSEDDTVAIAAAYGARVFSHEWADDFARARNESLERARGQWCLILDADELLLERDHAALREAVEGPRERAYSMLQRNYVDRDGLAGWCPNDGICERAEGLSGYVGAVQVRLVPRDRRFRYRGRVHEELGSSLEEAGVELHQSPVVVHHFGKVRSETVMRRKQELYTRLGQAKLAEGDAPPVALYEMGVQYLEIGRREEARASFERYLERPHHDYFAARATAFLGQLLADEGDPDGAIAVLEGGLRRCGADIALWESLIGVLLRSGRTARALEVLQGALRVFPDQFGLLLEQGSLYLDLRQWSEAAASLECARRLHPRSERAVGGLAVARLMTGGPAELSGVLELGAGAPDPARVLGGVATALTRLGRGPLAMELLRAAPAALQPEILGHLRTLAQRVASPA